MNSLPAQSGNLVTLQESYRSEMGEHNEYSVMPQAERLLSDSASFYAADACAFTRIIDRFPEFSSGISETASTEVVNSPLSRLARVECRC